MKNEIEFIDKFLAHKFPQYTKREVEPFCCSITETTSAAITQATFNSAFGKSTANGGKTLLFGNLETTLNPIAFVSTGTFEVYDAVGLVCAKGMYQNLEADLGANETRPTRFPIHQQWSDILFDYIASGNWTDCHFTANFAGYRIRLTN